MISPRKSSGITMRKYYQLALIVVCFISIVTLLIYRHEYYRLRYVLEVLNFFGKPGLSEVEFCGPGFNATILSELLRNTSIQVRESPPMFQQIDDNFYTYTSFLRSYEKYEKLTKEAHTIDTIVIGKSHSQPNFRCNIWLENFDKPKAGKFTFKILKEDVNDYSLYIFHCYLTKNLGKPRGVSFYVNNYNINPTYAPINRVIEVNTKQPPRQDLNIRFVNNIEPAICVLPNRVPIVSRDAFIEFLVFHRMMGVNQFTIYDSMISEDVIKRFNLLPADITRWHIQFFPLNYPFVFAKSYEVVRFAIELDCLFRNFKVDKDEIDRASHVIVLSWDEFLVPRLHGNIKTVLDDLDPTRKLRTLELKPLIFCLNQIDDKQSEITYPNIMKKTYYYKINEEDNKLIYIRNLDSMNSFDDIFNLNSSRNNVSTNIVAVHKYSECRDTKGFQANAVEYNETEMQKFQHKFEGAMIKFAPSLMNDKIYKLYRSGKIWEKPTNDYVREML